MQMYMLKNAIEAVLLHAPKEDVRYYLKGVNFYYHDGIILGVAASDGHTCSAVVLQPEQFDLYAMLSQPSFILGYEELKEFLFVQEVCPNVMDLTVDPMTYEVSFNNSFTKHTLKAIDGKYPDVKRLFFAERVNPTNTLTIKFDPILFTRLNQSFTKLRKGVKKAPGKIYAMTHHYGGAQDSVYTEITFNEVELHQMIMPLKDKPKNGGS